MPLQKSPSNQLPKLVDVQQKVCPSVRPKCRTVRLDRPRPPTPTRPYMACNFNTYIAQEYSLQQLNLLRLIGYHDSEEIKRIPLRWPQYRRSFPRLISETSDKKVSPDAKKHLPLSLEALGGTAEPFPVSPLTTRTGPSSRYRHSLGLVSLRVTLVGFRGSFFGTVLGSRPVQLK